MRMCIFLMSVFSILLTLSACHQKPVKSVVTPLGTPSKQEISSFELLLLSEYAHDGWSEIELAGRKWYIDAETTLTRNEIASLSFGHSDKNEVLLYIIPNLQGQVKINNALRNKASFIVMVLNGQAISLSRLVSSTTVPFYVGDEDTTIKVVEEITQKKFFHN